MTAAPFRAGTHRCKGKHNGRLRNTHVGFRHHRYTYWKKNTPRDTNTDKLRSKHIETDMRMTRAESKIREHKESPGPHHTLRAAGRDNGRKN